ncbi:exported hypothetical protein [Actinacidiphila bryophytorum]|uniref:Uncharacterized protein n=1 Tax=Actinacidiphila bryophytorum TaxID=1436133 RepID=A0A9W4E059_9ACTN|nr:exported hypothetical protein [Actinacidiphila bryophytorum]
MAQRNRRRVRSRRERLPVPPARVASATTMLHSIERTFSMPNAQWLGDTPLSPLGFPLSPHRSESSTGTP